MATWKKIVVSGSNAELNKLNVGTNQQISSSAGSTFLSGSFSGSFEGTLKSALANTTQPNIVGYDIATGLFSYQGTGSFTAATASYVTASNVFGPYGASSVLSASFAVTAAYADNVPATSSYALQALSASNAGTASLVNTIFVPGASQYFIPFVTNSDSGTGSKQLYISGSNFSYEPQANTLNVPNLNGTASRATTASYASNADLLDGLNSTVFAQTGSNTFTGAQIISSSLTVFTGSGIEFQVLATGVKIGNIITDAHAITGSVGVSGSVTATGFTGPLTGTASYATQALNASTASYVVNAQTASYVLNAVSASFATSALSSSFASTAGNANSVSNAITNNTNNYILTATGGGSINGESTLTYDGSTLTVGGNANITGNLTVAGTASFYNQTTLEVADKFIILASGSTSLTDGGIIIAAGGTGQNISGSAFFLESVSAGTGGRFAIAANVHQSASSVAADEFMVSAKISGSAPSVDPTWGGSGNGGGNIYINSSNGDIYIYS
jgi:hypothetical protein